MKANWKTYAFWIGLAEGVGALAGFVTMEATKAFSDTVNQPPFSPPMILFPIVWGILYLLMGIGAAKVSLTPGSKDRSIALNVFVFQLAVNFFWSLIFFNFQAYGVAFGFLLLLWVLIVVMIFAFHAVSPLAAWLQLPYLLWVTFAVYLNYSAWMLNR